jgi:hypothetical protein
MSPTISISDEEKKDSFERFHLHVLQADFVNGLIVNLNIEKYLIIRFEYDSGVGYFCQKQFC